jgi:hypothetical protein
MNERRAGMDRSGGRCVATRAPDPLFGGRFAVAHGSRVFRGRTLHFAFFAWAVWTGVVATLGGCAGSLNDAAEFDADSRSSVDGGEGTPACAADVPTTIFQRTCGVSGCHTAAFPAQGLDLASPGVASRLVDVPETEVPALGLLLVDSAKPQSSVILTKLQTATVPYGAVMPFGGTPLSPQEVACVAAWIDGAIADGGSAGATDGDGDAADDAPAEDSTGPEGATGTPIDAATDGGGTATLTVLNYKSWCSVTINGGAASTDATVTASVVSGSTATMVATPASSKFVIGKDPWFGVTQNDGGAAPGTDHGSGTTETSTATVVATENRCVSVCCGDAPNGTNCPTMNPCP